MNCFFASVHGQRGPLDAEAHALQLGADGGGPFEELVQAALHRTKREAGGGFERRARRAGEEPVQLGETDLGLGLLFGAELLDARDLDLDAQDVLLRPLADGVARARDAFDLLPDLLLVADEVEEVAAEEEAVVGTLDRGGDAAADALGLLLDLPGLARRDVAAQATLPGIRQLLARHEAERRHLLGAEARRPAVVRVPDGEHRVRQRAGLGRPLPRRRRRLSRGRDVGVLRERFVDQRGEGRILHRHRPGDLRPGGGGCEEES